jgi:hypothetical protein
MSKFSLSPEYAVVFKEIKERIARAQTRALLSVNAERCGGTGTSAASSTPGRRKKAGGLPS